MNGEIIEMFPIEKRLLCVPLGERITVNEILQTFANKQRLISGT